jgi:Fur family transcriptional regulator, ferric uptake regulator
MQIKTIIENKKLKLTSARKELLEIFTLEGRPLSFEDVKSKLSMDKATFYRNVSKFEDESILTSFESNNKKRYYEIRKVPHAHFICNNCNKIECLEDIEQIEIKGYLISDMILKGVCKECNSL